MPIYEYRCNKCKKKFDIVVMSVKEKYTAACKKCGSTDVAKLVSRVRYMSGPREDGLAENAERRLLKSMGGSVSDETRKQVRELAKTAAKRGKKRFDKMMDTGKSDSVDY
jgi:putative FmdB family regulatory protein